MTEDNLSDLIALFGFKKKHELTQHCRQVFLQTDLTRLIQAAKSGQLPWQYLSHHRNLVPEQLSLTEKDLAAIATSGVGHLQPAAQKAVNKIDTIFNQRRLLSGHMFSTLICQIGTSSILTKGTLPPEATAGRKGRIFTSLINFGRTKPHRVYGKSSAHLRNRGSMPHSIFASGAMDDKRDRPSGISFARPRAREIRRIEIDLLHLHHDSMQRAVADLGQRRDFTGAGFEERGAQIRRQWHRGGENGVHLAFG